MLVPALVPELAPLPLRGDIQLNAPSFAWRRGGASGTFDATWRHAGVMAGGWVIELGTVSAQGTPVTDGIAAIVRNVGGDVVIGGSVTARGGLLDASLELTPTSLAPQPLRTMLPLLGQADASGRVRVAWRSNRR